METKIQEIKVFETKLEEYYLGKYPESYCYDGIVNLEEYFKSDERILWVLKDTNGMAGLDMRQAEKWWGSHTFRKVVFSCFSIINKTSYKPDWSFEDILKKVASKIGYINIKKAEGGGSSKDFELMKAYKDDKIYIMEQIKIYEPTIIIFGNTFSYLREDLKSFEDPNHPFEIIGTDLLGVQKSSKALLLNAYHPAYFAISDQEYVDSIFYAYLEWRKLYPQKQS